MYFIKHHRDRLSRSLNLRSFVEADDRAETWRTVITRGGDAEDVTQSSTREPVTAHEFDFL